MIQNDDNLTMMVDVLPFHVDDYNMCIKSKSTFIDIGSGFGKPNFHAAMQSGCMSKGVEVVPSRVSFSTDQKYTFEEYYRNKMGKPTISPSKTYDNPLQ